MKYIRNKETDRAYYELNKDKIKSRVKKHKKDNREHYKKYKLQRLKERKAYVWEYKLSHSLC